MATVAIGLDSACAGGGHLTVGVTVDGAARQIQCLADDIISAEPDDLIRDFVLGVLRLHLKGMTRAQARAALQAGFTVTI